MPAEMKKRYRPNIQDKLSFVNEYLALKNEEEEKKTPLKDRTTQDKFAFDKGISKYSFQKWCQKGVIRMLESNAAKNKKTCRQDQGAKYPNIEKTVINLFESKRELGLKVKTSDLQKDALATAKRDGFQKFKASQSWVTNLKQKNDICWKKVTTSTIKTENQIRTSLENFFKILSVEVYPKSINPRHIVNFINI